MVRTLLRRLLTWGTVGVLAAAAMVVGLDGWLSRALPELRPWHDGERLVDFNAPEATTFDAYLALERNLFTRLDHLVRSDFASGATFPLFRYAPGGHPMQARLERDWNRTQVLEAPEPRGVFLMVHGLSDSPYSVRSFALEAQRRGYSVIALRLPGHGTIPGALDEVDWRDWTAAVRLAAEAAVARHPGLPFYYLGYSTGAPLGLHWVLSQLERGVKGASLPRRMFFLSPALGISPLARFANLQRAISHLSLFRKSRWASVLPEFDPVKYQSFAKNGVRQLATLLAEVHAQLYALRSSPLLEGLPPVTSFQSVIDETVSTYDLVDLLYGSLDDPQSELVLFDINRLASLAPFIGYSPERLIEALQRQAANRWKLTLISNRDPDSLVVSAQQYVSGEAEPSLTALPYAWPEALFSLSHVSLPFPPDDPVYGYDFQVDGRAARTLGNLRVKGERNVLVVPAGELMRLRSNPFHGYIVERIFDDLDGRG
jgi:alpha-beta hydrolase superfamily lysophospholipase